MTQHQGNAETLAAKDLKHLLHPMTYYRSYRENGAKVAAKAKGVYLWDTDDKQYLDGVAGLWCTAIGYGEEELARVAKEQIETLSFSPLFFGRSNEPSILLAEKLKSMMPFDAGRVFFGLSGSDANDTQVKLMWAYHNAIGKPEKKKFVARSGGYHGLTVGSGSLTGIPTFHKAFDLPLPGFLHTESPHYYRGAEDDESETQFVDRIVGSLESLIQREGPETIAAFIAEPITGAGGVVVPPQGYYEQVQEVLDRYGIFFIDDEVICGFGRTGQLFGAQTMNIKPTTISLAKAVSSAYLPLSAVVIPEFLAEPILDASNDIGVFGHGFTYSGHPVCTAVALRNLELMEERGVFEHAATMSGPFQQRLRALADHPLVGESRGKGLLGAVEIVQDKATKIPYPVQDGVGVYCMARCEANGLLLRPLGDALAICPPLVITEDQIHELFDKLERSLNETLEWTVGKNG
ncbi:aminotransferase [Pseudomonadales bacterium]|nr:aminotransferase [Pseudomonadales bacterium]